MTNLLNRHIFVNTYYALIKHFHKSISMPITLEPTDYEHIASIVRKKLLELMPDIEIDHGPLIFGPEFLSLPLRISTPSTQFKFSQTQKEYLTNLRQQINNSEQTAEEKARKNQQLDSIVLFGQLLFSQAASLHFLSKLHQEIPSSNLQELHTLANQESVQFSCSRFAVLSRRKQFKEQAAEIKRAIQQAPLEPEKKQELLDNLHKARGFYYQVNDLNFQYATKPSRDFSNFVRSYSNFGSKISLIASIIAIGATALALIPPLTPIMAPIAVVAAAISFSIGLPLALKNLGTMLYNLIRFGAEPTPAELLNTALLGTSLVLMGSAQIVQHAVGQGLLNKDANTIVSGIKTTNSLTKIAIGVRGQIREGSQSEVVSQFKAKLTKIKSSDNLIADDPTMVKPT